jgi:hypothetical protein
MKNKVEEFLTQLNHPLKIEFLELRSIILNHFPKLTEVIKWNATSYQINNIDFLTFNFSKSNEIRLIFHRGAAVKDQPKKPCIEDNSGILKWATNDRAIASFASLETLQNQKESLISIISKWMKTLES